MKNKMIIGITVLVGILLLSGCGQPTFNKNNRHIVFVEGKAYNIPYYANHDTKRLTKPDVKYEKRIGIKCNAGDIRWVATTLRKSGKLKGPSTTIAYYKAGKLGCAHPLSQQEYQYVLHQQNIRADNARATAILQQQTINNIANSLNDYSNQTYTRNTTSELNFAPDTFSRGAANTAGPSLGNDVYHATSVGDGSYRIRKAGGPRF